MSTAQEGTPVPEKSKAPAKPMHSFEAKPKARPITSWGGGARGVLQQQPQSVDQQEILRDIMMGAAASIAVRPQTAATTTLIDESRIINKLRILERIEAKIEDDLDAFI